MIDQTDLKWWLDLSRTLTWTWAKTYASTSPHDYVVLGRTTGIFQEDFVRAAKVIRTFGQPEQFYGHTNIYLADPVSGKKWWTMDEPLNATDLINRTEIDQLFGEQNAEKTESGKFTFYDKLSADYDSMRKSDSDKVEDATVRSLFITKFGAYAPTTLDVGCGTGLALDLGLTSAYVYTGVDPSRGMLNELVKKHPKVQSIVPCTGADAMNELEGTAFEAVISLFASPSYTSREVWEWMDELSMSLTMFMVYEKDYLPDYWEGAERDEMMKTINERNREMLDFADDHDANVFKIGRFDTIVIDK